MIREYFKRDSPILGRPMEMLWFGHAGRPMIWFPTSMGRFYQNEDFGLVAAVADRIDAGRLQVVCVDSVDSESFYSKGRHPAERIARHDQYDGYLKDEVVPWIWSRVGQSGRIGTLGASFGAYHAVNFALRHPDLVDQTVGFSGKYDIHSFLDGFWNDTAYFHCPTANVPNMDGEWVRKLSTMEIAIVTGETDNILEGSRQMIRILLENGIPHRGDIWPAPYGHDWPWWKEQILRYL
ncbi:MAG: esterase [Acidobacteria bacterium]|nr:esterase [Acidobacteriota bacterium]MCA1612284.1 esterase [Acidobacteriota bacterium]